MPKQIAVNVSADHLASLTASPRPLGSLAEVIWNGLDADASRVEVSIHRNALDGIEAIRVHDDGSGIPYDEAEACFGSLGDSWKKRRGRTPSGRGLHGKNGKGRFRAFGLGKRVIWFTTTTDTSGDKSNLIRYSITGQSSSIKNFLISDPSPAAAGATSGTEVIIDDLHKDFGVLVHRDTSQKLCQDFAAYLAQYPNVTIVYDGQALDPKALQERTEILACAPLTLSSGNQVQPRVRIIEWRVPVDRSLHLCDDTGVSRHEMKLGAGLRAPGFFFTAYLLCDAVKILESENRLELEESDPDVNALAQVVRQALKPYFRKRESENLSLMVSRWKEERIYPYPDEAPESAAEDAERQVFDIVAINVHEYLPDFDQAGEKSRRFTFRLIAQALKNNPESLQEIVGQVLGLNKEDQDEFAELLKRTPLTQLIKASKTVADRLDFLRGLQDLVFGKETKKRLLERDQLHKILEREAWLFNEEFTLAGSEQRLEEVLKKHLHILRAPSTIESPVEVGEGQTGRVDLMLHKTVQPRTGEFDYLIVELKRPSQKINATILQQVEGYAHAISRDERFHGVRTKWDLIVISNEMDEFAEAKASQRDRPLGLVWDDAKRNIRVWAKTWAQVIGDAEARLRFFRDQLNYVATQDSSRAYLEKIHSRFLPSTAPAESEADGDEATEPPNRAKTSAPAVTPAA